MDFNCHLFKKIFVLFMIPLTFTFAQNKVNRNTSRIEGIVIDAKTSVPMEYANIVLFSLPDSIQINGSITKTNGSFTIEDVIQGRYYLRASFMGFENYFSKEIVIKANTNFDIGKIKLITKSISMNEITVKSSGVSISYQIDKKVINVSENFSSISGTAVEVLENVPSVTVDIDGNVSLRGSGNFQVLIDGRPSILESNEALQQIPASSIENIEIITNPSAKYDPDGTAGIINVILKKNENWGISGTTSFNAGIGDKYGSEGIISSKSDLLQINLGLNYDKRNMTGTDTERNWTINNEKTSYYNSTGNSKRQRESYGFRGSISYDFGEEKILSIGGRYSKMSGLENADLDYSEWTSFNSNINSYLSKSGEDRSHSDYTVFSNYKHLLNKEGHELYAEVFLSGENSNDISANNLFNQTTMIDGKITTESGPSTEFRAKLDYSLPLGSYAKFEAGYQGETENANEKSSLAFYNTTFAEYELNPLYTNNLKFFTGEHALYSTYNDKIYGLGFKLGIRGEYTGRDIDIPLQKEKFSLSAWEVFPTAHFSYEIAAGNQVMVSYTKRINRPHGWDLEPCLVWEDSYNVRIGNPSVMPELIDSYELGFQTIMGNSLFSVDTYYRITNNKIDRVRSVYTDKVTLQTSENVGKDYSLGAELFFNFDPIKNWNSNLMGNLYNYKIEGVLGKMPFLRESINWSTRFNNSIKLSGSTQVQVNFQYNSPTVSSQGRMEGFLSTNIALRHELFEKLLTATLQVRDVFGTAKHEFINESSNFYSYRYSKRESPILILNLRLNFNNFRSDDREESNDESNGNGEEG